MLNLYGTVRRLAGLAGPVTATATRTASTPADPFGRNDSDSATCEYVPNNVPLDPPPEMYC